MRVTYGWAAAWACPPESLLGWALSDGEHLDAEGVEAYADALAAAGFEPVGSPPAR
jgi:hypothetical protein